jgi:cold-inducible RNA-binding protein
VAGQRIGGQRARHDGTTGACWLKSAPPGNEKEEMSKKLFVGSLSWNTDDRSLRAAFSPHGEITEAIVITDRDSGRSRGFGFVTFADGQAAEKAAAALNQTELDGRTIRVDVAQEKDRDRDRDRGGYGRQGGGGGRW